MFFKYSKSRNSCRCGPTLPVLYDDRYTYHIGLVPAFYFYTIHLLVSAHWVGCGSSVIREAVPRIRARQGPTPHSTSVPQGMGWSAIPRTGRKAEDAQTWRQAVQHRSGRSDHPGRHGSSGSQNAKSQLGTGQERRATCYARHSSHTSGGAAPAMNRAAENTVRSGNPGRPRSGNQLKDPIPR